MATEITCAILAQGHRARVAALGGPGWRMDAATLIGEIEAGREYFVRLGLARVSVMVTECDGGKYLRTDSEASAGNDLLNLPACLQAPSP